MRLNKILLRSTSTQQYIAKDGTLVGAKEDAEAFYFNEHDISIFFVNVEGQFLKPIYDEDIKYVVNGFGICSQRCMRFETNKTISILHEDNQVWSLTTCDNGKACVVPRGNVSVEKMWQLEPAGDETPQSELRFCTISCMDTQLQHPSGTDFVLKIERGYQFMCDQRNRYLDLQRIDEGRSTAVKFKISRRPGIYMRGTHIMSTLGKLMLATRVRLLKDVHMQGLDACSVALPKNTVVDVMCMQLQSDGTQSLRICNTSSYPAGFVIGLTPADFSFVSYVLHAREFMSDCSERFEWIYYERTVVPMTRTTEESVAIGNINCARIPDGEHAHDTRSVLKPWNDRIDAVATKIKNMNLDVILLQEVDESAVLQLLRFGVIRRPTHAQHFVTKKGIKVGCSTSQIAIIYDGDKFSANGDAFQHGPSIGVSLKYKNATGSIGIVAVHLSPGHDTVHEDRRYAELEKITNSMMTLDKCDAFVIAGIFNSDPKNDGLKYLNRTVNSLMSQKGYKATSTNETFPSLQPTKAYTALWGKKIEFISTEPVPLAYLSDYNAVKWSVRLKIHSTDKSPTSSLLHMNERNKTGKMFDALAKNEVVSMSVLPFVSLISKYMNGPQHFVVASNPGVAVNLGGAAKGYPPIVELTDVMYFSNHAHLSSKQIMPTAMLLISEADWARLNHKNVLQSDTFAEDYEVIDVQLHSTSSKQLPFKKYVATFRFPRDLFHLPQIHNVLLPLINGIPLPVGTDVLKVDGSILGSPITSSVTTAPNGAINVIPNKTLMTKFRTVTKSSYLKDGHKEELAEAYALLEPLSRDMLAMIDMYPVVVKDTERPKFAERMQKLMAELAAPPLDLMTFVSYEAHRAFVFYYDTQEKTLITPNHLAKLLSTPRGLKIKDSILRNFEADSVQQWIETYPHLF